MSFCRCQEQEAYIDAIMSNKRSSGTGRHLHSRVISVCSVSDFPTNVGFREICRILSDIEPFCVNWSDFGCND